MRKNGWLIIVLIMVAAGVYLLVRPDYIKEGKEYLEQGNYGQAIVSFEKQLDKEKKLGETFLGLGIAYYELEEYQSSIDMFLRADEEGATLQKTTYRFIGNAHMKLEQYESAIEAYDLGIYAEGESETALKDMMFQRIAAYEKLADWDNAKKAVAEYLEMYPDDEQVMREAEFLETR